MIGSVQKARLSRGLILVLCLGLVPQTAADLSRMLSELSATRKQQQTAKLQLQQVESEAAAAAVAAAHTHAQLQVQLAEQAAELAAAKVDAENKAAQVRLHHTACTAAVAVLWLGVCALACTQHQCPTS